MTASTRFYLPGEHSFYLSHSILHTQIDWSTQSMLDLNKYPLFWSEAQIQIQIIHIFTHESLESLLLLLSCERNDDDCGYFLTGTYPIHEVFYLRPDNHLIKNSTSYSDVNWTRTMFQPRFKILID